MLEEPISAKSIEFTAETRVSGIEFVPNKMARLDKEDEEDYAILQKQLQVNKKLNHLLLRIWKMQ